MIKKTLKKYFTSLHYFYQHLGYRLFIVFCLSVLVGVLDGLGIAMFLPLLEMISDSSENITAENMGMMSFILDALNYLGLKLSLTVVLFTMMFFFVLKGFFLFLEQYKQVEYRTLFIRNIREENIKSLAKYKYDEFVKADTGRIQNTMSGEVSRVGQGFNAYMKLLQTFVLMIVYTLLAFLANHQFALMVIIGAAITNLFFKKLYKVTKRLSLELTKHNHGFQGLIIQQVTHFKYLKATGLIREYANKLVIKVAQIEKSQRKIGMLAALVQGIKEPLLIGVVIIVILIQINFLGGSLGLILLSILFFYRALTAVMQVQTVWNKYLELSGSFENQTNFTNELNRGREKVGDIKFTNFNKHIQLEKISFNYGDTRILKGIDLSIPKNSTIALVGESGSGKTTLLNIISGLLKPNDGKVLIDGCNLNNINTPSYQRRIGYITQEPVIFNDNIFNNITFWDKPNKENIEKFQDAITKSRLFDFIQNLPEKENTILGNNGINISGGQKQRLSIARELYKNVDFLFLDEATSALDTETEKQIQDSFSSLKGKYTIIIIAHRLSTIKDADQVVIFNKGEIENIDTYQNLVHKSQTFKKMIDQQNL